MQCEICGRFLERGKRTRVEGSIVITCDECAKHGTVIGPVHAHSFKQHVRKIVFDHSPKPDPLDAVGQAELVDDYDAVVRKNRENWKMKQEELARAINEPESVVRRIESGSLEPTEKIAKKLEHVLKVKLLKKAAPIEPVAETRKEKDKELTLGDMVVVKKRGQK